jgi:hypothetical protein
MVYGQKYLLKIEMPWRNRLNEFLAPVSRKARNRIRTRRALETRKRQEEMLLENRRYREQQETERQRRERERLEALRQSGEERARSFFEEQRQRMAELERQEEERQRQAAEEQQRRQNEERRRLNEEQRRRYNLNVPSESIAFEIHNKSKQFMDKKDELIMILLNDLQQFQQIETSKYDKNEIFNYLRNKMGNYIDTSPAFMNIRTDLKTKFDKVIEKAEQGTKYDESITSKDYTIMGLITDFVFAHNLQELFIRSYVEDCAGAYKTGNGVSCVKGIIERFTMTLLAVISVESGGVYDELKNYFGISVNTNTPWNQMSNEQKEIVKKRFGESVENWKKNYNANPSKYTNSASRRQGAYNYVLQNYKRKTGKNISESLKKVVENEFVPSDPSTFNMVYAFDGGSWKTLKRSKKSKKTMRRRKH